MHARRPRGAGGWRQCKKPLIFSMPRGARRPAKGSPGGWGAMRTAPVHKTRRRDFSKPARCLAGGAGKRGRSGSGGGEIDARRVSARRGGGPGAVARARRRRKAYSRLFSHSRPKMYPLLTRINLGSGNPAPGRRTPVAAPGLNFLASGKADYTGVSLENWEFPPPPHYAGVSLEMGNFLQPPSRPPPY